MVYFLKSLASALQDSRFYQPFKPPKILAPAERFLALLADILLRRTININIAISNIKCLSSPV